MCIDRLGTKTRKMRKVTRRKSDFDDESENLASEKEDGEDMPSLEDEIRIEKLGKSCLTAKDRKYQKNFG